MAGLFDSPQDVAIAQLRERGSGDIRASLRQSLFNVGNDLGNAGIRSLGGDTRTPEVIRATQLQDIVSKMDWNDPKSISGTASKLNQDGFQAEAFKVMELMPKASKKGKGTFQDLFNKDTNTYEKHFFEDGVDKGMVGVTKPGDTIDEDGVSYRFLGTVRLPNGDETSARFDKSKEGIDAMQIRVGDEWISAPAGTSVISRNVNEEPPISATPNKTEITQAAKLISQDNDLGSMFTGLNKKDKLDVATRTASRARKLMRDDRSLDTASAIDMAFKEIKNEAVTSGSFLGFKFGTRAKTPEEITSTPGFRIIQ